jgi:hypothetical protein
MKEVALSLTSNTASFAYRFKSPKKVAKHDSKTFNTLELQKKSEDPETPLLGLGYPIVGRACL